MLKESVCDVVIYDYWEDYNELIIFCLNSCLLYNSVKIRW